MCKIEYRLVSFVASWFLTERGREVCSALVNGTALGKSGFELAKHTVLLEKHKNSVHHCRNGEKVKLPKELVKRCEECVKELNINPDKNNLIKPFSVHGYDPYHAGTVKSNFGVAVGIPENFKYKTVEEIDILKYMEQNNMRANLKKFEWDSEVGKKLADSIILSEKVQRFAICRELLMSCTHKVVLEALYPYINIFFAYNFSTYLNRRFNLHASPAMLRGVLYTIIGVLGLGTYCLMKDKTQAHFEAEVDKKLSELGPEFVENGFIFYSKLLQRNQALRLLMGEEGKLKYTPLGNENFLFRQGNLALDQRKSFFEQKLQNLAD